MRKKITASLSLIFAAIFAVYFGLRIQNSTRLSKNGLLQQKSSQVIENNDESKSKIQNSNDIIFVGPRDNVPKGAPKEEGFWSFAIVDPNVLSRSGQPTIKDFKWLKDNDWKSVVDMRVEGDHGEQADDAKIAGFNELGFNYLRIQIVDGAAPTDEQAEQFLKFVTNPQNQPLHVHCRGGIGRAGTMIVLYRYSVQGWPMDKAIQESRAFRGGISSKQEKWLLNWAKTHSPGSYKN